MAKDVGSQIIVHKEQDMTEQGACHNPGAPLWACCYILSIPNQLHMGEKETADKAIAQRPKKKEHSSYWIEYEWQFDYWALDRAPLWSDLVTYFQKVIDVLTCSVNDLICLGPL